MTGYVFGANTGMARAGSASITLVIPTGAIAGNLITFKVNINATGATVTINGTALSGNPPRANNVYQLSPTATTDSICFGYIMQPGDVAGTTSFTFAWSSGTAATGDVAYWTGSIYTDLTTIVVASGSRQATSTTLVSLNGTTVTPTVNNCLLLAGGRRVRTTSTSGTFGAVTQGSFTNPTTLNAYQPVGAIGFGHASVWDYWIQTTATAVASCSQAWSQTDGNNNEQGWLIALQPGISVVPYPPMNNGGMIVQVCQ